MNGLFRRFIAPLLVRLSNLDKTRRLALTMLNDALAMLTALWLSFSVRLGSFYVPDRPSIYALALATIVVGLICLVTMRIYNMVVRYTDDRAAAKLLMGAAAAGIVWFVSAFLSGIDNLPRSVGLIYFVFLFLMMYFSRIGMAVLLRRNSAGEFTRPGGGEGVRSRAEVKPAAIYGANGSSQGLAGALREHPEFELRFFVEDNPALAGRTMLGRPIRSTADLAAAAKSGEVRHVFLALPDSRVDRIALISRLSALGLKVMTLPSYNQLVSGRFTVSDVRPINVEDLLARDPIPPIPQLIERGVAGRTILVTGAGGSIGSEIARKVLNYKPKRVVLFDHAEYALFSIHESLKLLADPSIELMPIIGSLLDAQLIERTLIANGVDVVFHAAAYKHVPLLETNEISAIRNNVLGTKNLADLSLKTGVERMTMVSTDKAVRPISLMGASKRLAELYVQALAARPRTSTCFGIVRFGNVLDSSGSVVEQFRRQIHKGGPVTVTHEDITRFFMSIPEACDLVLQANSMAEGGEVFVLDMGEPVRIAELARTMITLSGLSERTAAHPDGDIAITYVGLRPGEKLFEELFASSEVFETQHPQIRMARERWIPLPVIEGMLDELHECLDAHDRHHLRRLIADFLKVDEPRRVDQDA